MLEKKKIENQLSEKRLGKILTKAKAANVNYCWGDEGALNSMRKT